MPIPSSLLSAFCAIPLSEWRAPNTISQPMGDAQESFYADLPELTQFEEAVSTHLHRQVPDSWHIIITDVQGSTRAIEDGRYKDVNAVGVASIIALRNAVPDVELPYVFGGDGATILIPASRVEAAEKALRGVRAVSEQAFDLSLRVSHVPIARLSQFGHPVFVGRYRISENIVLAALSGRGVSVAEQWVKDPEAGLEFAVSEDGPSEADLEGFECRWQPAPSRRGRMVSLLVVALGDLGTREDTYRQTLNALSALMEEEEDHPLSARQMSLQPLSGDFSVEARLRSGELDGAGYRTAYRRARRLSFAGRNLMRLGISAGGFDGRTYMSEFLANTDFQKFDEALRMVRDMTESEIEKLDRYLKDRYAQGKLAYGMHLSGEALITCMVRSYGGNHVHFVDGADGGYALAAKQLKAQLKALGH